MSGNGISLTMDYDLFAGEWLRVVCGAQGLYGNPTAVEVVQVQSVCTDKAYIFHIGSWRWWYWCYSNSPRWSKPQQKCYCTTTHGTQSHIQLVTMRLETV